MAIVLCRCRQCGETYKHDASKESASMEDFLLSRESYPVDFGICHACMKVMEDALIKNKRVRDPNIPLELPPADLPNTNKKEEMRNDSPVLSAILGLLLVLSIITSVTSVAGFITSVKDRDQLAARIEHLETISHYQGKDVNGNEVWAPAVTIVELPKKRD